MAVTQRHEIASASKHLGSTLVSQVQADYREIDRVPIFLQQQWVLWQHPECWVQESQWPLGLEGYLVLEQR